jgi:superfamily II DNA or RNA helicase
MFSILSKNGYGILKSDCSIPDLEKIKDELTMKPHKNFSMTGNEPETVFTLYRENDKRLYVPRFYGLQKFGAPTLNKLSTCKECNLEFIGRLREAQEEPVANFLEAARDPLKMGGIISVPCGFGKTIMSLYIACLLKKKTMFVSHKDFLNQQFIDTVKEFAPSARVGRIKQSKVDVKDKDIIIASLQSLAMRDYPSEIFEDIGFVIIDEVHHTGAQVFCQAFRKLSNPIMLGLSATLNRKDGMRKVFEYYIGKSVYNVKNKESTEVNVEIHKYFETHVDYSTVRMMWNGKENMAAMINNICSFKPRTEYIISVLKSILEKEPDRKVLILSERRNQLKDIETYIVRDNIANTGYGYYVGGMTQENLNKSAEKQIILATYQLASEGFNVPSLNTLIFASPISDIQQSIGRILRERPDKRKYTPLCIDIVDDFSFFKNKGYTRLRYYKKYEYSVSYYRDNQKLVFNEDTYKKDEKPSLQFIDDD